MGLVDEEPRQATVLVLISRPVPEVVPGHHLAGAQDDAKVLIWAISTWSSRLFSSAPWNRTEEWNFCCMPLLVKATCVSRSALMLKMLTVCYDVPASAVEFGRRGFGDEKQASWRIERAWVEADDQMGDKERRLTA